MCQMQVSESCWLRPLYESNHLSSGHKYKPLKTEYPIQALMYKGNLVKTK